MKKIAFFTILLPVFLCICIAANAQDKLYLRDGTVLNAKVKEVGPRNIVYVKWENQDGPEYYVTRREVESIKYQNGTEEVLETRGHFPRRRPMRTEDDDAPADGTRPDDSYRSRDREPGVLPGYGKNILSIAPVQMTNESVAGVGIQYERMLDKRQIISLYIPLAISFFTDDNYYNIYGDKKQRVFTTLYPGIKIYPAGSAHRITYSVGPSVAFGFGTKYKESVTYDPFTGNPSYTYKDASIFKSGIMINNGINMQPTKKLYIGIEFGLGFLYTNNESTDFTVGNDPLVQFNFKLGYRF